MLSSPFDGLGLHILPESQYVFSPALEDIRGRHVPQGLVIAPAVVVADEGHDGHLQVWGHLIGQLVHVPLEGLVIALKLPVGLRVEGSSQDVLDSHHA